MFIVTAKLNKKRAIVIVLAVALILTAIIVLAGRRDRDTTDIPAETTADIVAYLEALGWQVAPEPIEVQEILIPREFDTVYNAYNAMQLEAGFDLRDHRGRPATRYRWQVLNYPDQTEGVIADVLVSGGYIIGGDIQSINIDGFIHGLFPNRSV